MATDGDAGQFWCPGVLAIDQWIQLELGTEHTVAELGFLQRQNTNEDNKELWLSFSDSSTQSVTLADDNSFTQMFDLTPVVTSFVKITIISVYDHSNNGAAEIVIYGMPTTTSAPPDASCAASVTLSGNEGANDNGSQTASGGGYEFTLANGDTVWSQSWYGEDRSPTQAFDGATGLNWSGAWHGSYSGQTNQGGADWRTTPLQLHYTFTAGARVIEGVKLWQVPGNGHQAGRVDVQYWKDGAWVAASGQSPTGMLSTSYGAETTITVDPVQTSRIRLDVYSHTQASSPSYVGLTEVQIFGCDVPVAGTLLGGTVFGDNAGG